MSNPFDQNNPGGSADGGQPDYDAYQYPSGGTATPSNQPGPAYPDYDPQPGYGGTTPYGGVDAGAHWAMSEEKNRVAPWALGIGIIAVVLGVSVLGTVLAAVPGVIGVVVGIIALARGRRIHGPGRRTGMAVTAIILSLIAIALSVIFWVLAATLLSQTGVGDCLAITDIDQQQVCIENSLNDWVEN